ncbi:efflux RND transporter periplasmic adaptor subunit [bacterium]|nr:efflux RND transporter periplasmic adaptor subunit [bacterium]
MKKNVITAVLLIFVALFGWQIYQSVSQKTKSSEQKRERPAIAVEVAPITKTTIREVRQFSGTLTPQSQFVLAPKISGRLEQLTVDIGDKVQKGQLIARLDSREYYQDVEQAKADLEVTKANVLECKSTIETTKRELERAKILREKKIASESELDKAESAYKVAEAKYKVAIAQVKQKEESLKNAQIKLSYTEVRAVWDGENNVRLVGERYVNEGDMLSANASIISLIDNDSLTGVIYITEESYSSIHIGQPVVITTDAHPGKEFSGKISRISPTLQETTRSARIEVTVANHNHLLKSGVFVKAEIELARHTGATVVPFASILTRDEKEGVFLVDLEEKKAKFVPVKTGIVNTEDVEILQPQIDGYVVTLGQHLLDDGSPIVLPEERFSTPKEENQPSGEPNHSGGNR